MKYLFALIGAVIGASLEVPGIMLGAAVGFALGWMQELAAETKALGTRLDMFSQVLMEVNRRQAVVAAPEADAPEEDAPPVPPVGEELEEEMPVFEAEPVLPAEAQPAHTVVEEIVSEEQETPRSAPDRPAEAPPGGLESQIRESLQRAWTFITGINTVALAGMVVIFFGMGFLVKYAVENALFPLELRLAMAAVSGIVLLGVGWRLRDRSRAYGLILQGGGAAILYLTIYASYALYSLIPSSAAFFAMAAVSLLMAGIALLQDAQILAVVAVLGGFFAPVLASSGDGRYVVLFTYYALLNLGVVATAWFKPWRVVNLAGFVCTFGVAAVWGGLDYRPALFKTVEPFLIVFFLQYFAVSILHIRNRAPNLRGGVDGTLVFGLPVVAFTLQAGLVSEIPYGLAWSALALGLFYFVAARLLNGAAREPLRVMVEAFIGVGLALATMTIPFAFDATWSGTGWAVEGAALVWLGFRQAERRLRWVGMLLQVAAGLMFLYGFQPGPEELAIANRAFLGFLSLALAATFTAHRYFKREEEAGTWERLLGAWFLWAGVFWWGFGGLYEVIRTVGDDRELNAVIGFMAATGLGYALLSRVLLWPALRYPSRLLVPLLLLVVPLVWMVQVHPFVHGGWIAWPVAFAVVYGLLYLERGSEPDVILRFLHAAALWLLALVLTPECIWLVTQMDQVGDAWGIVAGGALPLLLVYLVTWAAERSREEGRSLWPVGAHSGVYLLLGVVPMLVWVWLWSVYTSLDNAAGPAPLPYLPLLNPVSVVLGVAVVVAIRWYRAAGATVNLSQMVVPAKVLLGASLFLYLNADIARAVHFWGGVAYDGNALFASSLFQTATSIVWTILGVALMIFAARRPVRAVWMVGAGLLAVVVVKLFAIDLSSISTISRIITFIVVGLLLLIVAYIAPIPPRRTAAQPDPLSHPTSDEV